MRKRAETCRDTTPLGVVLRGVKPVVCREKNINNKKSLLVQPDFWCHVPPLPRGVTTLFPASLQTLRRPTCKCKPMDTSTPTPTTARTIDAANATNATNVSVVSVTVSNTNTDTNLSSNTASDAAFDAASAAASDAAASASDTDTCSVFDFDSDSDSDSDADVDADTATSATAATGATGATGATNTSCASPPYVTSPGELRAYATYDGFGFATPPPSGHTVPSRSSQPSRSSSPSRSASPSPSPVVVVCDHDGPMCPDGDCKQLPELNDHKLWDSFMKGFRGLPPTERAGFVDGVLPLGTSNYSLTVDNVEPCIMDLLRELHKHGLRAAAAAAAASDHTQDHEDAHEDAHEHKDAHAHAQAATAATAATTATASTASTASTVAYIRAATAATTALQHCDAVLPCNLIGTLLFLLQVFLMKRDTTTVRTLLAAVGVVCKRQREALTRSGAVLYHVPCSVRDRHAPHVHPFATALWHRCVRSGVVDLSGDDDNDDDDDAEPVFNFSLHLVSAEDAATHVPQRRVAAAIIDAGCLLTIDTVVAALAEASGCDGVSRADVQWRPVDDPTCGLKPAHGVGAALQAVMPEPSTCACDFETTDTVARLHHLTNLALTELRQHPSPFMGVVGSSVAAYVHAFGNDVCRFLSVDGPTSSQLACGLQRLADTRSAQYPLLSSQYPLLSSTTAPFDTAVAADCHHYGCTQRGFSISFSEDWSTSWMAEDVSDGVSDRVADRVSDGVSDRVADRVSDGVSDRVADHVSESTSSGPDGTSDTPDRVAESASDDVHGAVHAAADRDVEQLVVAVAAVEDAEPALASDGTFIPIAIVEPQASFDVQDEPAVEGAPSPAPVEYDAVTSVAPIRVTRSSVVDSCKLPLTNRPQRSTMTSSSKKRDDACRATPLHDVNKRPMTRRRHE